MSSPAVRFAPGTFAPGPRPAPWPAMLAAQSRLELKLLLRNGEQLLLTMFIPVAMLVALSVLPIEGSASGDHRVIKAVPAVMMVAVMSTAFTGQAIAIGFDRRYGALKRIGATALPRWGVIAGKSIAVAIVVVVQAAVLGLLGLLLGWRPEPAGLLLGGLVIALGTVMFAAMGMLLGGTLKAEVVLALANILWVVQLGLGSLILVHSLPYAAQIAVRLIPSGALAHCLESAASGAVDWLGVAALAVWTVLLARIATVKFRFS
jgi:ABC-2 type transport system permease protein